jgi:nondiscriminating aspartyl-tRNA synthetase
MKRILSTELKSFAGEEVSVKGWLHTVRALGKLTFLLLRDRAGLTQVVIESKEEFSKVRSLQPGSVIHVVGTVQLSDKADRGVEIISPSSDCVLKV